MYKQLNEETKKSVKKIIIEINTSKTEKSGSRTS
jgi:hypothetical protein